MKKLSKVCILSIILIILSISFASASTIGGDNIQTSVDDMDIQEISIDEVSSIEEKDDLSAVSNSCQMADENGGDELIADENIPQNDVLSAGSSANVHKVSPSNYSKYFKNGYVNTSIVKSGDIIDLSGNFNKVNFTFTIPCSITSSLKNAYLTNCVVKYENVSSSIYSNVSNLRFTVHLEKHPCVYVVYSNHVNVFNCNAYSTGANSNPTLLVGSSYCNIHDNVFETTFTGYMNMSWKRAGILLGESHYNNIYRNDVTIKDSNGIYLTTYGFDKSNYNNIYNNTIKSSAISEETGLPNPSAWAYGVHIMGDYNKAINNTIYLMYRGVDSEGSFNEIIGNNIYDLAGSYYEGNNGTDGGEYGIHASYDNTIINNTIHDSKITGSAIYVTVNCTAYGNIIQNISGEHAFEFSISASNTLVKDNFINMTSGNGMYIRGNMTNVTVCENDIHSPEGTAIIVKVLSKAKIPDFIYIENNRIFDCNGTAINFAEVENKSNITFINNSIIISNSTFFNAFDSEGIMKDQKAIDNILFKGEFADLPIDSITINQGINILGENCQITDISFNIYSPNIKIENIHLIIQNGNDAFHLDNVENISFINNTITVDSANYALVLNNSKINMVDNLITINDYSPAILNDNGSYILYGENIIKTLADIDIESLNDSTLKITVFIVSDDNYDSIFNSAGNFHDDFDIAIGDTLKIANLTNKTIRIDIPLIISPYKDSTINNSTIILEDMASSTNISDLRFKLENGNLNKDFSFIIIKDGVSNLIIENNHFDVSNLLGDAKLSAIKIIGSDESAKNIRISNNSFILTADLNSISAISALNEGFNNYDDITDSLTLINNNISIANSREDGASYGINLINSKNLKISSNDIDVSGNTAFGLYLNKISSSSIKDNVIYENNEFVNIVHSNNPTKDIQNAIDGALSGDIIYLGNSLYTIKDSIIVNKSISIVGGILLDNIDSSSNQLLSSDDPLFVVAGKNTVNFSNMTVILNNNDLFILSLLKNSTNSVDVDCPIVSVKNSNFTKNNDAVDEASIYLAKVISERPLFEIANGINLEDNNLIENMNQIKYYLFNDSDSNEINFNNGVKTFILPVHLICTALDKDIYGNMFGYFEVELVDENANRLSNKSIYISYNNAIYNLISDSNGKVKLPVNINDYGISNLLVSFLGDTEYSASFAPGKVTVNKQKASLTAPNKSYYVNAVKYLKATFKDANGNLIKNKKISFIVNGKTYNAYTNSKGVATVKVKLTVAKTYVVTVNYAGDSVYSPISKSFKVYVKKVPTKLIVKNKSYKKSKKIKKLTATLKTKSGKALAKKKLTFIVNGKKYTAKTNKKGVATVKVKVSKKKTYKFTVKFAGGSTYLKTSKKAKLKIK
ncbi:Ig-like domain-containing protein [uncultured Methanobrevibacter sp.]|uniref:Ig-like domain-containing protein n=1 Tax=uncultured Methanobrevibacter sp. TaxID=253161 RepID=UPI0025EA0598|nr:Ig-like domain-containing protein [uncultured Methanobrevibacter sp.]